MVGVVFVGLHIFLPDPEHAVGRLFLKRADLGDSLPDFVDRFHLFGKIINGGDVFL